MSQVVIDPRGVDLDVSRYSQGSTASSITLGGENYPIGSKVGTSGLFVIGDPNFGAPKQTSSTRSSLTTLSQPTGSSNYLLNEGYDFEDWNWPVVRFSCLALLLALMVGLLATVVALAVEGQKSCHLDLDWWQGSVIYHINVGEFSDSDHDEVGDLSGIKKRLDYLEYLGVKVICLNHFLPSLKPGFDQVTSFSGVDRRLGTSDDMQSLAGALHHRGMRLMLEFDPVWTSDAHDWFRKSRVQSSSTGNHYKDVYIWRASQPSYERWTWQLDPLRNQFYLHLNNSEHPLLNWANLRTAVQFEEELKYWLDLDVDGFYIRGINKFELGSDFGQYGAVLSYLQGWRRLLDNHKSSWGARVIMVEGDFMLKVQQQRKEILEPMLKVVNLVDRRLDLDMKNLTYSLQSEVNIGLSWQQTGLSWVAWHIGAFDKLIDQRYVAALEMLVMVLPGNPSLYAGQEVGIDPYDTSYTGTRFQLMDWSVPGSGQLSRPYKKGSMLDVTTMDPLSAVIKLRHREPALRSDIDGRNHKDSKRHLGIEFLQVDPNLIFLKRFYFKRNIYFYAINLGDRDLTKDWSTTTSAGFYKTDTTGELRGGVSMNSVPLNKGQGILFYVPV